MRKGFLSILLTVLLIWALAIPSFAAVNLDVEVNQTHVSIKGTSNYQYMPVSIRVFDDSRSYYIDQGITREDGSFEFNFKLDENSEYDAKINIGGEIKEFSISTTGYSGEEPGLEKTVYISIKGYNNQTILSRTRMKINDGDTVLDVLMRVLNEHNIPYVVDKGYVRSINELSEFDYGPGSGWMFKVNGSFPDVGADSVVVRNGDVIVWLYTTDLGRDVGDDSYLRITDQFDLKQLIEKAERLLNDKNADQKEMDETFNNLISAFDGTNGSDENSTARNIIERLAGKIIEKAGNVEIGFREMREDEEKVYIELNERNLVNIAVEVSTLADKIEKKLKEKDIDIFRALEKKVSVQIPAIERHEIVINLPPDLLISIFEKGLNKLEIKTEIAELGITPGALNGWAKGEEVKFAVKKTDSTQIPEDVKRNVPENSIIVEFNLTAGDERIDRFNEPIEVAIPYNGPAEDGDTITAFLLKDDGTVEAVGGLYDPLSKKVKFITSHFSRYFAKCSVDEFDDLENYEWAEKTIEIMAGKGFVRGKGERRFDPSADITRGEFTAIITRMFKYEALDDIELPFEDVVPEKWYYKAVAAAYSNGLINGRSNTIFDPEGFITRQEMAKITAGILEKKSYKLLNVNVLDMFDDSEDIADWAKASVELTARLGIVKGIDDERFSPAEKVNRAQAAVMLYRLYRLLILDPIFH